MKHRALLLVVLLIAPSAFYTQAAEIYRVAGQGAAAGLFSYSYDPDTGLTTMADMHIQVGQIDAKQPPQYREDLLLASVYYWVDECDAEWNCSSQNLYSGEVELSPDAVVFSRDAVTLEVTLDLYEGWEGDDPVPLQINLTWDARGVHPFRTNGHYHILSEWEVSNRHSTYLSRDARITGTLVLEGKDLLSEGYEAAGVIESGREGYVRIARRAK